MPLSHDVALDEVVLELAHHCAGPVAAIANEANASSRQSLDGRNADLLAQTFSYDLTFLQGDEKDTAHFFSARRAAAIASCAFE